MLFYKLVNILLLVTVTTNLKTALSIIPWATTSPEIAQVVARGAKSANCFQAKDSL
jgi:hypothetical protein